MYNISAPLDEEEYTQNVNRLGAIATTTLGDLTDEVVLELLAERRSLGKENAAYERLRDEESSRAAALTAEEQALEHELEELNSSITPDKDDDTLLTLIQHRKELEARLKALSEEAEKILGKILQAGDSSKDEGTEVVPAPVETDTAVSEEASAPGGEIEGGNEKSDVSEEKREATVREEESMVSAVLPLGSPQSVAPVAEEVPAEEKKEALDPLIGREGIRANSNSQEATKYLQFLESNPEEALSQLETLPEYLRKDKVFMLQVAKVDPAYAMHYADAKTLKRDEDFNVRIAGMKNPRDSGNPLAEMLADMRTNQVVLAAVKQDFRNLRYATQSMEGYADMIEIAKREAREKVKALGQAVDVRVFLPKTLRNDPVFLEEIEGMVAKLKEKSM
jgi:hypothetical protein